MFDPELYRDKAEVDAWKQRDPIEQYRAKLERHGLLDAGERAAMEARVMGAVQTAVDFAETGTWEPAESLIRNVYDDTAGAL